VSELIENEITEITGVDDFTSLWAQINTETIGIVPIENSYA